MNKILNYFTIFLVLIALIFLSSDVGPVKAQTVTYYLGAGMFWEGTVVDSAPANAVQAFFYPIDPVVGFLMVYGSDVGIGNNPKISTAWGYSNYRITNEVSSTAGLLGKTTCTGYGSSSNYVVTVVCPALAPGAYQYLFVTNWGTVPAGNQTYYAGKCEMTDPNHPYPSLSSAFLSSTIR